MEVGEKITCRAIHEGKKTCIEFAYTNSEMYPCRKLRNLDAGQLLVNLSFGLLGIYVMFIVSLLGTEPEEFCAVAGGLLHYFMLATFFLMAAEAISLYLKLVVVLGIPEFLSNRYVLKVSLISWSK